MLGGVYLSGFHFYPLLVIGASRRQSATFGVKRRRRVETSSKEVKVLAPIPTVGFFEGWFKNLPICGYIQNKQFTHLPANVPARVHLLVSG